jgi:ethanolamine utilization protein EutK
MGVTAQDTINALGFVEVRGLAAAIETADSMLKTAEVRLLRQLLRDPVQTTITVEGELGACRAAVDAGRAAALRMNAFIACQVMGRPADDTAEFVLSLAEAGSRPFGSTPAPAPTDDPGRASDDTRLLAALAALPGGAGARNLAERSGGTLEQVQQRLEALCASGKLVKRRGRYRLAKPGGGAK